MIVEKGDLGNLKKTRPLALAIGFAVARDMRALEVA
jgi:hypothetical protein